MELTLRRLLDVLRALVPPAWRPALVTCRVRHGGTSVAIARMRLRRTRANRGTSISDMLVGIGIAAATMAIAVPQLSTLIQPHRVQAATRALASQFALARMKAIAQNTRYRVHFDDGAGTYALESETGANSWTAVGGTRQLPDGLSFSDVATDPIVTTQGMLSQGFNVSVSSAGYSQTVSVNVLGKVDIGDMYATDQG